MAEGKLREAWYFLKRLHDLRDNHREFKYNLSAFVTAWRSVCDVLLYDYAEKYFRTNRESERITQETFQMAARAVKNVIPDAEKFIDWYNKKLNILAKQAKHLWHLRVISVHKGGPPTFVITDAVEFQIHIARPGVVHERVAPSVKRVKPAIPTYIGDYSPDQYLTICKKGYALMKGIVEEAREKFK